MEHEKLLELDEPELKALFDEGLFCVGPKAYRAMFDKDPPKSPAYKAEHSSEDWEEEKEILMSRFPEAWSSLAWEQYEAGQPTPSMGQKPWWKFWRCLATAFRKA